VTGAIHIAPREAQALSQYLVGRTCSDEMALRYSDTLTKLNASLSPGQEKTWSKMISSSIYMKLVDGGLALSAPQSPLRKRIFIMLTLLECSPDYTESFLPQQRSMWYLIPLGFRAAMSAVYGVAGLVMVKTLKVV